MAFNDCRRNAKWNRNGEIWLALLLVVASGDGHFLIEQAEIFIRVEICFVQTNPSFNGKWEQQFQ